MRLDPVQNVRGDAVCATLPEGLMALFHKSQRLNAVVETAFVATPDKTGALRSMVRLAASKIDRLLFAAANHPGSSMAQDSAHGEHVGGRGDHVGFFVALGGVMATLR